jgi:hypothetical protein
MARLPLLLAATLAACVTAGTLPAAEAAPTAREVRRTVHYRLEIPAPATQWVHVTLTVARPRGLKTSLAMPAWTPGSYLVRDHARHVDELRAEDLRGRPLAVTRVDKQTWRIDHGVAGFRVRYRVFAGEPGVRTSFVDDRHAVLNGAGVFLYLVGETGRNADVEVSLPGGWQAHTALEPALPGTAGTARFSAPDYDTLDRRAARPRRPRGPRVHRRRRPHRARVHAPAGSNADPPASPPTCRRSSRRSPDDGRPPARPLRVPRRRRRDRRRRPRARQQHAHACPKGHVRRASRLPPDRQPRRPRVLPHVERQAHPRRRPRPLRLLRRDPLRLLWFHEGFTETMEQQALLRAGLVAATIGYASSPAPGPPTSAAPGATTVPLPELSFDAWTKAYKPAPATATPRQLLREGLPARRLPRPRAAPALREAQPGRLAHRPVPPPDGQPRRARQGHRVRRHRRGRQRRGRRGDGRLLRPPRRRHRGAPAPRPAQTDRRDRHQRRRPAPYSGLVLEGARHHQNVEPGSPAAPPA